jgi:hypothetical protein
VQKFLWDSEQSQRIAPALKDKMVKLGLPKEELSWIFGQQSWKDFSLEERVKRFLSMSEQDYLNLENEVEIGPLIIEILSKDRQDLFNDILNKWKEFLRVGSPDLRRSVIKSFMHIIESIPISRPELLIILFDVVFSQLETEQQMDIYALLLNEIAKPLGYLIDSGNFAHAKIILEKLNKENSRVQDSLERRKCIQELMERIFQVDRVKLIVAEFIKRIDNASYYEDVKDFMLNIGEAVVDPLLDEAMIDDKVLSYLGYFGAYLRRRGIGEILAQLISKFGGQVVTRELTDKLNDSRWYVVKNAVELFMYLHNPQLAKLLENYLKHPDINIRKKVVFVLAKIGGAEATLLLIEALKDPDMSIRLNAIQALSRIGEASVLEALKSSHQPDLKEELSKAIVSVEKLLDKHLKRE